MYRKVEEHEAVRMSSCELCWVGGWVGWVEEEVWMGSLWWVGG